MLLNKKLMLLIAFICLLFCVATVQDTYAKYTSAINETTDISIARWRILVNDFDIRSSASTTNLIEPQFNGNANIAADVIAPTATGSFTMEVDATDTDLSFNYEITVSNSVNSPVTDIEVTTCTLNGTPVNVVNGVVSGTITLADQRVNTFVFNIQWKDGTGETMDNADDTATTTLQESVAKLSVVAHFTQLGTATPTPTPTVAPTATPEPTPVVTPDPNEI